jgi:Ca2+-binding EF-hand superfamily protein
MCWYQRFFQFDSDHSGHISQQEFETGIKALNAIMPKPLTEKERGQIHTAFTMMEENKKKYGEMVI